MEGALELEFNKSKLPLIKKSIVVALIPMMALGFILAGAFYYYQLHYGSGDIDPDFRKALIGAIPLAVISSSIAIPSAANLSKKNKEFITYETSLSDILGVLFFDFIFRNVTIDFHSFWIFILQIILIAVVSFVAIIALSFLLARINHQIKFIPIIILVILIYTASKIYHLPALIFIMLFGMFLGNIEEIKKIKFLEKFKFRKLENEVPKFHEILIEGTFLIRVMFFLLFGFLINTKELLNHQTFYWAASIVGLIFIIRLIQLKVSRLPLMPLVFFAPRGLITILLFLYIAPGDRIDLVNESLIIQIILLTVVVMMIGMIFDKKKDDQLANKESAMHPLEPETSSDISKVEEGNQTQAKELESNSKIEDENQSTNTENTDEHRKEKAL